MNEGKELQGYRTLRPRATRYFGPRKSLDTSDPGQFGRDTGTDAKQFQRDTVPPVIRLKLGAEVSGHFGTNFVVPKCPAAEVSGSRTYITTSVDSGLKTAGLKDISSQDRTGQIR